MKKSASLANHYHKITNNSTVASSITGRATVK